ncbi:hypothetical protein [Paraeggerthella hongkongensis]|uniref:hypothetical protein n=1 Tax=Paraeggerthella hongkongensis TaxID=230658 RepID=UPI001FCEFB0A|nr:hypothetical protein [Paraeggerthella hongkongensis]
METNMQQVESTKAAPAIAYKDLRANKGPTRFAKAAHANIVAIIATSNISWLATSAAGNEIKEPTNTISIQARYTPSPKKNKGIEGSQGKRGPGGHLCCSLCSFFAIKSPQNAAPLAACLQLIVPKDTTASKSLQKQTARKPLVKLG